jgi:hypothetical protein
MSAYDPKRTSTAGIITIIKYADEFAVNIGVHALVMR